VGGCGPHRGVCCHSVRTNSDSLNIDHRSRNLVHCHSVVATCRTSDQGEETAALSIGGSRNTSAELVADIHALLDSVGCGVAAVGRVVGRTREGLITVYSVGGTVRVGVVLVLVGWAKSFSWRGDSRAGRRRNSNAATIVWWKIGRSAGRRCAATVRRRRIARWCRACCALSIRRRRVVRRWR
jgi:hypothetical protein